MKSINLLINAFVENWTIILLIASCILYLVNRIKNFLKMSKEEQVTSALKIIKEELLKLMMDSEIEWAEISKSGELKRAQVINEIYKQFPFLSSYVNQNYVIEKIDEMIDDVKEDLDILMDNPVLSINEIIGNSPEKETELMLDEDELDKEAEKLLESLFSKCTDKDE